MLAPSERLSVKRVMLLMASRTYKARAFLAAARKLDCAVVVATDRMQVLSRLDPAGNLLLPFHDVSRAVQAILEHHAQFPVDAILATDDEGAVIAAAANHALGLPANSVQAVSNATHKGRTRQRFAAAALPTPAFREVHDIQEAQAATARIGYPCVVKPLNMSASRGVMRVNDDNELHVACDRLQAILTADAAQQPAADKELAAAPWLVEAYIPGKEFALEGVLRDGALHTLALFDKPDPLEGPFFQETIYVTPSRLPVRRQEAIATAVGRAAQALQLQEGPIHAEVRCEGETDIVLEIAPRSIGGRCSAALRFGEEGGTSLEEVLLAWALRINKPLPPRESQASGVLMIPIPFAGILRQVGGIDTARAVTGVTGLEITIPVGQAIQPPPDGWQYLGFVFAHATLPETAEHTLRTAHARLQIDIERRPGPQALASKEKHDRSH